jgi:hypothetical protein
VLELLGLSQLWLVSPSLLKDDVVVGILISSLIESSELLEDNATLEFPRLSLDSLDDTTMVRWHAFVLFFLPVAGLSFVLEAINVSRE